MSKLDLSIFIQAIDKFSVPAKKIVGISDKMAKSMVSGQKELNALGKQKSGIAMFKRLGVELRKTGVSMKHAQDDVAKLGKAISNTSNPSKKMIREFEQARQKSARLKSSYAAQSTRLKTLRDDLRAAGIESGQLAAHEKALGARIETTTKKMQQQSILAEKRQAIEQRRDKSLQRAANLSFVAQSVGSVGRGLIGAIAAPVERMRAVQQSRGTLQSLGMDKSGIDAVVKAAHAMTKAYAGIDTDSFTAAAYDIKSGIGNLTGEGVARMTALASLTAKATGSSTAGMTSLFATGYGVFKKNLFKNIGDVDFGKIFSAGIASSVKRFKTDGVKMQRAIESMGSGLAAAGVPLQDQLTALGMLQQKMQASEAGVSVKAFASKAAQADAYFKKVGISISTLNDKGNVLSIPEILKQAKAAFGSQYTSKVGAVMLKAFGSEEAVRVFEGLWGQSGEFAKNSAGILADTKKGELFTQKMAKNMDNNVDARLKLLSQRWGLIQEKLGTALIPMLEKMIPIIETVGSAISSFIDRVPNAAGLIMGAVAVIGGIALVLAPVVTAVAALTGSLAFLRAGLAKTRLAAERGSGAGGGFFGGGKGGGIKGFFGKLFSRKGFGSAMKGAGGFLKGKGGYIGAALTAASIGSTLFSDRKDKGTEIAKDVGGIGGALAGAAMGAAIGSVIPVAGNAIGAAIGLALGGLGFNFGSKAGGAVAGLFSPDKKTQIAKAAPAALAASLAMASPAIAQPKPLIQPVSPAAQQLPQLAALTAQPVTPKTTVVHQDNRANYTLHMTVNGGDPEHTRRVVNNALAEKEREHAARTRGALFDIQGG